MSQSELQGGRLLSLYERYVGEPDTKKDVYGYWIFIAGYLLGLAGVMVILFESLSTAATEADFVLREIAISLAATGLPLALLGIVLLLPVRRRGLQATMVGAVLAGIGVLAFISVYPGDWNFGQDYSPEIIAIYITGIAIVGGVAVLVPVLTGKKSLFMSPENIGTDEPPIMLGETNRAAMFAIFRNANAEWTWRVIDQRAVGNSLVNENTRGDARGSVETAKQKIGEAGLVEITTAAFRLYEDEMGRWRWVLMRDDGSVVAGSPGQYPERNGAEDSVSLLKEYGPSAPMIDIDGAAFNWYADGGDWRWRLLDDDRTVLAESATAYDDEETTERSIARVRTLVADARVLALDLLGAELFEVNDGWRWRLLDGTDEHVATSAATFGSRRMAESAVDDVLGRLGSATVMERETARYEVYESDAGAWDWRLVDDGDSVIATSHDRADSWTDARTTAERTAAAAEEADVIEIESADYEIYRSGEEWHWRFVTDDRTVVADRTDGHEDPEAAREAIERVRERAQEADLIEFENAAFQQYEADTGEWRWRLIDEDGNVMADSGEAYDSKADASSAMATLKENAPDAELLEIDTAAFELFRDENDEWGWRLIDETGRLVADGASRHPSRQDARQAMDYMIEHSPTAAVRTMDAAGFQLYTDRDEDWRWRLIHPDGTILGEGVEGYATRDDAESGVAAVRTPASVADSHIIREYSVEISGEDGWRWFLVDRDRDVVAEGHGTFDDRESVIETVEEIRENAGDAAVFEIEDAAIRLAGRDGTWRWELIDEERTVLATGPGLYETRDEAREEIDRVRSLAPDAGHVDFGTTSFELHREGNQWRWRLLDADETVVATGSSDHDARADAIEALDDVRSIAGGASMLELDDPAFELHEIEGGWLWRLVDENGTALAESLSPFPTRQEAREATNALKELAPEGTMSVAEQA